MAKPTILIDLERCTGCWTCSFACKFGNGLSDDVWWQTVRTLGSGEGIDRPAGQWPNLTMSWMPVHSDKCILCKNRTAIGDSPYCAHSCPTQALVYGDLDDPSSQIAQKLTDLRDKGFRVFQLPSWENSKKEVIYASKH